MTDFALPEFFLSSNRPKKLPVVARKILEVQNRFQLFEKSDLEQQDRVLSGRLAALLSHAKRHSPFWKDRLQSWSPGNQNLHESLSSVSPLSRDELQSHCDALIAHFPERERMRVERRSSSGSTGIPVHVEQLSEYYWPSQYASRLRECAWHNIDPRKSLGILSGKAKDHDNREMGYPFQWFGPTGISFSRCTKDREDEELYDYCASRNPSYLLSGATTFTALARHAIQSGRSDLRPELVLSYGSAVTEEARETVHEGLGTKMIDRYSSEETGIIAIQCSKYNHLHVLSPVTLVEIVDENNAACAVGQPGQVLVTAMQSYGMPLIRYEIGDVAEWGEPCDCGIALPVIKQLWGRTRQFITNPDGRTTFARIYARDFKDLHGLQEYRFVLHKNNVVVAQIKAKAPSQEMTDAIIERAQRALSYPYPVMVQYVDNIDWGASWKKENFDVSDAPAPETTPTSSSND